MVRSVCFCFHLSIGIFFISSLILSVNHWLLSSTLFMSYFSISLFSPLSRTYSSAASFCLNCYLYFYVYDRLVTFLDLGEVAFCGRHLHSPLSTQAICSRVSLKRAAWGLCRGRLTTWAVCGRFGWPLAWLVSKPCLCGWGWLLLSGIWL